MPWQTVFYKDILNLTLRIIQFIEELIFEARIKSVETAKFNILKNFQLYGSSYADTLRGSNKTILHERIYTWMNGTSSTPALLLTAGSICDIDFDCSYSKTTDDLFNIITNRQVTNSKTTANVAIMAPNTSSSILLGWITTLFSSSQCARSSHWVNTIM